MSVRFPAWGLLALSLSAAPVWAQGVGDLLDPFSDLNRAESDVPLSAKPPVDDDTPATGLGRLEEITRTLEWLDKKDARLLEAAEALCAKADAYHGDAKALLARIDKVPGLVSKLQAKLSEQGPVRPEIFHRMAAAAEDIWHGVELDALVLEAAVDEIDIKAAGACDRAEAVRPGTPAAQDDLARARAAVAALVDERQNAANVLIRLAGDINRIRELQANLQRSRGNTPITSDPSYGEVAEITHKARFGQAYLQGISVGLNQKLAEHAAIYQEAKGLEEESRRLSVGPSEAGEQRALSDRITASWEGIGLRVSGPWSDLFYCGRKTDDLSSRLDKKWSATRDSWVALLDRAAAALPAHDIEAARKKLGGLVARADKAIDAARKIASNVARRVDESKGCLREAELRMGEQPTRYAGDGPGGGPALDATAALEEGRSILYRMQQYGAAATAAAANTATFCELARGEAHRAGAAVDRLAVMIKAMATPPGGARITRKPLSDRIAQWLAEADLRQQEAAKAAKGILDARRELEVHVGNVCRNASGLPGLSRATLQARHDTAESARKAAQRAVSTSRKQYGLLHNTVAEAEALLNEADAATGAAAPSDKVEPTRAAARAAKVAIDQTKDFRDRVWRQYTELERLQMRASDLPRQAWRALEPHLEGKDGNKAKALYDRIEKALNALADKKAAAEACLAGVDEKTAALETRTARLTGQLDKIAARAAAAGSSDDLAALRQRVDDVRTTAAAAEGFAQAAEGQVNQADFCLGEIRNALNRPARKDPALALANEAFATCDLRSAKMHIANIRDAAARKRMTARLDSHRPMQRRFATGESLYRQGRYDAALERMREALEATSDSACQNKIASAMERVKKRKRESKAASVARAALRSCDLPKARKLIDALPAGVTKDALLAELRRERQAVKLYQKGKALFRRKDYDHARTRMREAREVAHNPACRARIDKAIATIEQRQDKARRQRASKPPGAGGDPFDYGAYVRETEGEQGVEAWCRRRDPNARSADRGGRTDCVCAQGMRWDASGMKCISNREYDYALATEECPRRFPDSMPVWQPQERRHSCGCPGHLTWNRDRTACVTPPPESRRGGREREPDWDDLPRVPRADSYAQARNECTAIARGSVPRFNAATNRYDCECPGNTYIHDGACISEAEAVQVRCRQQMRGSQARRSPAGFVCRCPSGTEPNRSETACVARGTPPQIAGGGRSPRCPKPLVWDYYRKECYNPSGSGYAAGPESCRPGEIWAYGACIKKPRDGSAGGRSGGGGAKPPARKGWVVWSGTDSHGWPSISISELKVFEASRFRNKRLISGPYREERQARASICRSLKRYRAAPLVGGMVAEYSGRTVAVYGNGRCP